MKIIHLINPFKANENNPSFLSHTQPITFQSIYNAKKEAEKNGIKVIVCAACYKEDLDIVPDFMLRLSPLVRSSIDQHPKLSEKKLPIISEMFQKIANIDGEYVVFSNVDIILQKNFYVEVAKLVKKGFDSFVINRRDGLPKYFNGRPVNPDDLPKLYRIGGLKHPGKDCFVFKKTFLPKVNMGNLFIGYPPWGKVLHLTLKKMDRTHRVFENLFLTFHIGSDVPWFTHKPKIHPLWKANKGHARALGFRA